MWAPAGPFLSTDSEGDARPTGPVATMKIPDVGPTRFEEHQDLPI